MKTRRASVAIAMAALLPLGLAACGSDDSSSDAAGGSSDTSSSSSSSSSSTTEDTAASGEFGPACASVPATGAGSFEGMSKDPVATAASNNPALKTLVAAVGAAGLGETLNAAQDITVFAPADAAFTELGKTVDLNAVLADKPMLTKILQNHVVPGRLTPETLAGEHKTLAGTTIKVTGSGEDFTVGDAGAKVVCGNVQTANATVYIIDGVLVPAE